MNDFLNQSFCHNPWYYMDIFMDYCKVCCWSNKKQPLIFDSDGDLDIISTWNGDICKQIRNEMMSNDWDNCMLDFCPFIGNKTLHKKTEFNFPSYNEISKYPIHINCVAQSACNLWCPQCRNSKVGNKNDGSFIVSDKIFRGIQKFLINSDFKVTLSMLGNGEPFYVTSIRKFLFETDFSNKPNISIGFNTNGTLFTNRTWDLMEKIQKCIKYLIISIDAASEETYDKIRLGGNWSQLIKNLEFISKLKREHKLESVILSMTVQTSNYKEICDFMKMSDRFGFGTYYSIIRSDNHPDRLNWFNEQMIWKKEHPLNKDFVKILNDPYLVGKNLGSIKNFQENSN